MRSVSNATWTFVLPVSSTPEPNFAAISRLRSVVIVIAAAQASSLWRQAWAIAYNCRCTVQSSQRSSGGESARDLACSFDVATHLLYQLLGRLEAPLAAQPREEVETQLFTV